MPTYDTPGVYIEEQTGPGVIAGVGTSTAAFIGPALAGPINEPLRITSYDEFLASYAVLVDGILNPYMFDPHWFYMAHAVRGFFQNGGSRAYIVRVGTAVSATWTISNQGGPAVFRVQALADGAAGNNLTIETQDANATGAAGVQLATGSATVTGISGLDVTVNNAAPFRVGDTVTEDQAARTQITGIDGNVLTLASTLAGLANGDTLRLAHLVPAQNRIRLAATTGIFPGSVVLVRGRNPADSADVEDYAVIQSVDAAGFVTFASAPARTDTFNLALAGPPVLISQEFRLLVTPASGTAESFDDLSLSPQHPGYIFSAVNSALVRILPPLVPPTTVAYPDRLVNAATPAANPPGQNDNPGALASTHFQAGLDALRHIDDINIVCIPDASSHAERVTIQQAARDHCQSLGDRFAVLDSRPGAPNSGAGGVEEQKGTVESDRGFAALYYPWLEVRDPLSAVIPPRTMFVPPSGYIAGVYARTDQERGVHKAPANTDVRGVLGLERRLSDAQQAPLNANGINVLRIFPGTSTVQVWGARTTSPQALTEWRYVNVRRLMLYIEESIEEGIRWAVFEPNGLPLWQQLKRTLREFLTRVWRDGALFGDTPDKAFYVRIDEALNTPAVRALGRLYIEIGIAPVYPAEFIIVRIGLWDGGSEVTEG